LHIDPSKGPLKSKLFKDDLSEKIILAHVMRNSCSPDAFGPTWYLGIAFQKKIKLIYETSILLKRFCDFMRAVDLKDKELEVDGLNKQVEAIALSVPDLEGYRIAILTGDIDHSYQTRTDVFLRGRVTRSGGVLAWFKPLMFPSARASDRDELISTYCEAALKDHVMKKLGTWKVLFLKVDFRYSKYLANRDYIFRDDVDPLSAYCWLIMGVGGPLSESDVFTDDPVMKNRICGLNMKYEYLNYGKQPRKAMLQLGDFYEVELRFQEKKKSLEIDEDEVDLDGFLKQDKHREVDPLDIPDDDDGIPDDLEENNEPVQKLGDPYNNPDANVVLDEFPDEGVMFDVVPKDLKEPKGLVKQPEEKKLNYLPPVKVEANNSTPKTNTIVKPKVVVTPKTEEVVDKVNVSEQSVMDMFSVGFRPSNKRPKVFNPEKEDK